MLQSSWDFNNKNFKTHNTEGKNKPQGQRNNTIRKNNKIKAHTFCNSR